MALTRIVKGMIGSGAVTPSNIETTSTFAFNKVSTPEIAVAGAAGLKLTTLRNSTSTSIAFYNPGTGELSYGPASAAGGGTAYNQSLNTTDKVTFAGVAASTATIGSLNINGAFTLPTTAGTNGQLVGTNGAGQWVYRAAPDQALFTTSSVTFKSITVTDPFSVNSGTMTKLLLEGKAGQGFPNSHPQLTFGTDYFDYYSIGIPNSTSTTAKIIFNNVNAPTATTWKMSQGHDGVWLWQSVPDYFIAQPDKSIYKNGYRWYKQNELLFEMDTNGGLTFASTSTPYKGITSSGGFFIDTGVDKIRFKSVVQSDKDILPATNAAYLSGQNLGSATKRWNTGYINTLVVSRNTIYFEDVESDTTSTLSVQTGTIFLDGSAVIDQNVTAGGSPIFSDTTITNSLTIGDYTMPIASASTAGYAMVTDGSGSIEFQQAVLSSNISIDGGFSTSVYTMDDFRVDGGGAFA